MNRFDGIVQSLQAEVYEQPESAGHTRAIYDVVDEWVAGKVKTVLDVGCGRGEAVEYMVKNGINAHGVTIGPDYGWIRDNKPYLTVFNEDMHYLSQQNDSYDMVFCRHALEHAWGPLVVLRTFRMITKRFLVVVVPPHTIGVVGDNHYSVLTGDMWKRLFGLAGFKLIEEKEKVDPMVEIRYLLEKIV